jgi:phosphate transport system substrate-binding protein
VGGRIGVLWLAASLLVAGCGSRNPDPNAEDSLTSGTISVVCVPEAMELARDQIRSFEALYLDARIELRDGTSRDAVGALFGARTDLAVISRDLVPEERRAAMQGRLEIEGYPCGRDALVLVVHADNPVQNLALDDLRRIYDGSIVHWRELGGSAGRIVPLVQPEGSDITEFFREKVLGGEAVRARVVTVAGDSAVVSRVAADRGAIGFASMGLSGGRAVRLLQIAPVTGLAYVKPDAQTVYEDVYPLTRPLNLYVRADGPPLAKGLVTFVTSSEGQRIVHRHGLVPTAIPVRFARRSPMLGTHTTGDSTVDHER